MPTRARRAQRRVSVQAAPSTTKPPSKTRHVPTSAAGFGHAHWLHRGFRIVRATDMPVISTHGLLHDAAFVDDAPIAGLPNATPRAWRSSIARARSPGLEPSQSSQPRRGAHLGAVASQVALAGVSDALGADLSCCPDLEVVGMGAAVRLGGDVEIVDDLSGEAEQRQVEWDGATGRPEQVCRGGASAQPPHEFHFT